MNGATSLADGIASALESIGSPALKVKIEEVDKTRLEQSLASKEDELKRIARKSPFVRIPYWAYDLPITRRQREILGLVYSFQCSTSKDGRSLEFRMSASKAGSVLRVSRTHVTDDLAALSRAGYLEKGSFGQGKPAGYIVNEGFCRFSIRDPEWSRFVDGEAAPARFIRIPYWAYFLDLRQPTGHGARGANRCWREILGLVYSFQCSTSENGEPHEFRMSCENAAARLGIDRSNMHRELKSMCDANYLSKRSNGRGRPATYVVNEAFCIETALFNGWSPKERETK